MKAFFYFLLVASSFFLTSCLVTYGDYNTSQITNLSTVRCDSLPANVHLFFEGETINFDYEQVGFIEATGKKYASDQEVLNHLRYEAWQNCADGIVGIKKVYRGREQGTLFNDASEETYEAPVFTGLAVRIKRDSMFVAKYGHRTDTTFITQVRKERTKESNKTSNQFTFSILGTLAVVIFALVYVGSQ